MIVSIPRDEWMQAVDLVKFTAPDHATATGYVRVFTQEGQRYWMELLVFTFREIAIAQNGLSIFR